MSRSDRLIGILLGIVVGVAALIFFIFLGSSGSIDAPSLNTQHSSSSTSIQQDAGGENR
jgi:hypothetical protein